MRVRRFASILQGRRGMSDDARLDLDAGLWLSVSEIARQKDKTRQAIAKRVDALVEAGKIETRPDLDAGDTPASPALRDHQARAAQYTADLKFLDLEERLGRLVPIEEAR